MIKSLGPLHWHMEAYLRLFLISFMACVVSFDSDTCTRAYAHTYPRWQKASTGLFQVMKAIF